MRRARGEGGKEAGSAPLQPGTLAVSAAEWAAALFCEPMAPLPAGACALDFEGTEDGSLSERFGLLLRRADRAGGEVGGRKELDSHPLHIRAAHWLHECIVESKLVAYPLYLTLYLQTRNVAADCAQPGAPCSPSSLACSAMAADQLVTAQQFYRYVREGIGAKHAPLISEAFLVGRCDAVRAAIAEDGDLTRRLDAALRAHHRGPDSVVSAADTALVALYSRFHGLPGRIGLPVELGGGGGALTVLRRLRRLLPGASVEGLRKLAAALELGDAALRR